ncbi:MAG: Ig-like domain-containing protein [Candidatus Kerfeldbacteria bacterium]|nr:Ig-like domain-containing protein [Candidatus Kerfeldbacteria bacterium]
MKDTLKKNKNSLLGVFGFLLIVAIVGAAGWLAVPETSAQVNLDPNLGTTFGLGTADLLSTVINIVQWALGFLGLIAVIFIMYGGFVWMTAAGNQEKVEKAKKIITRAVIGLVIVLLAWAIVTFIVDRALDLTGGNGSSCTDGDVNGCYLCSSGSWVYQNAWPGCNAGGANFFDVVDTYPADGQTGVYLCSIVQAEFNGNIDAATVPGAAFVYVNGGGQNGDACTANTDCASGVCAATCQGNSVPGNWNASGDTLEFLPSQEHLPNTIYQVYLCGSGAGNPDCTSQIEEDAATPRQFIGEIWFFTTGNSTLNEPPEVTAIYPADAAANICLNTTIAANFSQPIRKASLNANTVQFTTGGGPVGLRTPFSIPSTWDSFSTRPSNAMTAGAEYNVKLIAGTPGNTDPNNGIMDVCLNHLDGDYNNNEDGSPGDDFMTINNEPSGGEVAPWNFFADTDTTNIECTPEISSIVPASQRYDADPGITINGSNLSINGDIRFELNVMHDNRCMDVNGTPNQACVASWTGDQISTRIPAGPVAFAGESPSAGAADGNVRVEIGAGDDEKSNTYAFDVSSPQIRRALGINNQAHGGISQAVKLERRTGNANDGFGAPGTVEFFNISTQARMPADTLNCSTTWTNNYALIKVPDLSSIGVTACDTSIYSWYDCPTAVPNSVVGIQLFGAGGAQPSNIIKFIYTTETPGPVLCEVVPECGNAGAAITLTGEAFGASQGSGRVWISSPPVSAPVTGWNEGTITATVPNLRNGVHEVNVEDDNGKSSYSMDFQIPCGDIPQVVENASCAATCNGGPNDGNLCSDDSQCPGGACQISMASPNPYKGTDDVCVNAMFGARFTVPMNTGTFNANIILESCGNDSSCAAPVAVTHNMGTFGAPLNERFIMQRTVAGVPTDLDPNTYYRVTIRRQVESTTGARMNADYVWLIKTKADTGPCPVENVMVTPGNAVLYNIGDTEPYLATAIGPNCALLDSSDYTWSWTSDSAIIASVTGSTTENETATGNALGTTYIRASTEGKSGRGKLKVDPASCAFNPTRCADPDQDGVNECAGSRCDLLSDRCVPVIADYNEDGQMISPQTGIAGSFVTIEGCYFGTARGTVNFGGTPGVYECTNAWSDHSITVSEPGNPVGTYLIDVRRPDGRCLGGTNDGLSCVNNSVCTGGGVCTTYATTDNSPYGANQNNIGVYYFSVGNVCSGICVGGANANQACQNNANCASNNCAPGVPAPSGVAPGICPPLNPDSGREGANVYIEGKNFNPPTLNPATTRVYYHSGLADTHTAITTRGQAWADTEINRSRVPAGTVTGGVSVQVNNCPSNSVTFRVSCDRNSQCSTGCCQANQCVASANCSSGTPGQLCQLTANNPFCQVGPVIPAGDYRCIDPAGHRQPNAPAGATYPPAAVDDCRTCCYPGQISSTGLTCSVNLPASQTACTGANRGLYCGCTGDAQCGGSTACGSDTCCHGRPTVVNTEPPSPSNCRNIRFQVDFSEKMDASSFVIGADYNAPQADESVFLYDATNNTTVAGTIKAYPLGFYLYPSVALTAGHTYRIFIRTELVKSDLGIAMSSVPGWHSETWVINGGAQICRIAGLRTIVMDENGFGQYPPQIPNFSCGFSGCDPGDIFATLEGANLLLLVDALDQNGTPISGGADPIDYTWSETDPRNVFTPNYDPGPPFTPGCPANQPSNFYCIITSDNHTGLGHLNVTADGSVTSFGDLGTYSGSVPIRASLCSRSWPNPRVPDNDVFPFEDTSYHFALWYCAEDGLALLRPTTEAVIKSNVPSVPQEDELVREFFFLRDGSTDAIGVRVMENEQKLSPTQWYRAQFGPAAPEPQPLTVDGYPAVRAGRTVYVAATNLSGGTVYANIYLMSYNDGASSETIEIFNRLLANWEFNTNLTGAQKGQLQRDLQRLSDLSDIAEKLINYKGANQKFPELSGGTYVKTVSNSLWPSWQDTLGVALGGNLPTDPVNDFEACTPNDETTCWNDATKKYQCNVGSKLYQYHTNEAGGIANLFTFLEYDGPGNWRTGLTNPCAGMTEAACNCFNYQYAVTGTNLDRNGPIITAVNGNPPGTTLVVAGTTNLVVTATDADSGVNSVEFYIDGIRQATDTDGTNGWSWSMNTGAFPDGNHSLGIKAYDVAGNYSDANFTLDIDNAGGGDASAPFARIISPTAGQTVSGMVSIQTEASDNYDIVSMTIEVRPNTCSSGQIFADTVPFGGIQTNASFNWSWDSSASASGTYCIWLDVIDGVRHGYATALVTLSNLDAINPTVNITAPVASPPSISGEVNITMTASDNIGVARVDVYIDGQYRGPASLSGGNYIWPWNTRAYPNGDHELRAYVYDLSGNTGSAIPIVVNVDNIENDIIAPTVSFIAPTPASGTAIEGVITIRVDAQDDKQVDRVNFYVDYLQRSIDTDGSNNWEWTFDTTGMTDGWHRIQVDALDVAGNRSEYIEVRLGINVPGGPLITNAGIDPASGPAGTPFCIQADVTSPTGVASVVASIQQPDEIELDRVTLTLTGGDTYQGSWTSPIGSPDQSYYVDIIAESTDGRVSEYENIHGATGSCGGGGGSAPVITSVLSRSLQEDTAFTYTITATNTPTSYNAVGMPAWMTRSGNVLSGTPPTPGTFTVAISATNAFGTDTRNLTVTVTAASSACDFCEFVGPNNCTTYTTSLSCNTAGCYWRNFPAPARCVDYPCSAYNGAQSACEARSSCSCTAT